MPPAHVADAVVLQKREQQLHFPLELIFSLLGQVALPDDLGDLPLHGNQLRVLMQEKQGEGQRHHGRRIFCLERVGRMLHHVQDHGPGGLVDHVRQLVAGQRHGQQPFPVSGVIVEAQGIGPVSRAAGQIASGQIDGLLPLLRQKLELFPEKCGKDGVQIERVGLLVKVDEGRLTLQQRLGQRPIHPGELRGLRKGKARKNGHGEKELPLRFQKPVPYHLMDQLGRPCCGKAAVFHVGHDLHVQGQHPASRRLMRGQSLSRHHVQPRLMEIGRRILRAEHKILRVHTVDAVIGEHGAHRQLPRYGHDVQLLATVLGQQPQKPLRLRQSGEFEAVQHQIGLPRTLQVFQHLRRIGGGIAVRDADGGKLFRAALVHPGDQPADAVPRGRRLPHQKGMPQHRRSLRQVLLQKMIQRSGLPKPCRRVGNGQRVVLQIAQLLLDHSREIKGGRVDLSSSWHTDPFLRSRHVQPAAYSIITAVFSGPVKPQFEPASKQGDPRKRQQRQGHPSQGWP